AFMGMLNKGMDIKDFEDRSKRSATQLTHQAVYAENMANLFLMELAQGRLEDFNAVLASAFHPMGTTAQPIRLFDEQLDAIRNLFGQLLNDWRELPFGETLVLEF
ncbi:MAG TPA: hypothetical protein VLD19_09590, partial [Chitinophagaceae bacterium]|nr:hypothetical protein [Chitinophagaceae bacterium]